MYDHFIALDWAQRNMAIACFSSGDLSPKIKDVPSNIKELKLYLSNLKGKKILTFEETNTSQWLFTELNFYADKILVCDPYRNHLLSDGAKTDKKDAVKLAQLLKANLLKEVYHSGHKYIFYRKLVSGYIDLIQRGVRMKNQRSALFRAKGKKYSEELTDYAERFVSLELELSIKNYEEAKASYQSEFKKICRKDPLVKSLSEIPGIAEVGAVKIVARVVEAERFPNKWDFLSYCGLVKHEKLSGGRSYGLRTPRHCRVLKGVFKTAAHTIFLNRESSSIFRDYYQNLMEEKQYPEFKARHALARKIAIIVWSMMKNKERFKKEKFLCNK